MTTTSLPTDRRYTEEHEWAKLEGELVVIGITDHAQRALGDVVYLELPEAGRKLTKGQAFGVVESVKAVSDLYAPIDGEVTEVNQPLVDQPEGVNKDPYGAAWLLKVRPASAADVAALLDAAGYEAVLAKEAK